MPSRVNTGEQRPESGVADAVCIHTRKIYDSSRSKDCGEDLRVYPTTASEEPLATAATVRAREANLLWVSSDVEELSFNRGYYTVDLTYYYRVVMDVCLQGRESTAEGLAFYSKRVILFGSEGGVRVFSSDQGTEAMSQRAQPISVVEAVDPILLRTRLADGTPPVQDALPCTIPQAAVNAFADPLLLDEPSRVLVTLGQFSIVRLERDTQLSIPCYDYCVPGEETIPTEEEDPCTLFSRIDFPTDDFFPPNVIRDPRFRDSSSQP